MKSTSRSRHGMALALFLTLGVAYTYPLVCRLTTAIPGTSQDHDVVAFVWNIWWTRHSLLDLHTSPLQTNYVFLPFTMDLRLHTYGLLYGLLSLPVQPCLGVVGAFNAILILTVALNGYATYVLAKHAFGREGPALVAGGLVALSPALLFHVSVGRPSFAAIWPVSLALLSLTRLAESPSWREALVLGLALLAAQFLDFQVLLYAGLWLAAFLAGQARRPGSLVLNRRFMVTALGGLLIGAVPFVTVFYPALATAGVRGYPEPTDYDTLGYSLRIWDYVTPWVVRRAFGLALPISAGIALVAARRSIALPWLIGAALFLVLCLGTVLQPTPIPLPFALLRRLPGLAQFRTPYRFTVPASLGLAMIGASGLSHLARRWAGSGREIAVSLLVLVLALADARAVMPLATQTYPDQETYRRLAAEPGASALLEVPVGVRSGIDQFGRGETLQFYQIIHGKPIVNGMVARVPRSVFAFYRASPSLCLLAGERVPEGADVRADFSRVLRELRIGAVVVHPGLLEPARLKEIDALIASSPELALLESTPSVRVYRVSVAAARASATSFRLPSAFAHSVASRP